MPEMLQPTQKGVNLKQFFSTISDNTATVIELRVLTGKVITRTFHRQGSSLVRSIPKKKLQDSR